MELHDALGKPACRNTITRPWLAVGATVWLCLAAMRSAAFIAAAGTGWDGPLLPWFAHAALLMEGTLAVTPLAVLITLALQAAHPVASRGRRTALPVIAAYALVSAVVVLYAASWSAFASVGQFLDLQAWRFWMANPVQNLRYVQEMEPQALWQVPLAAAAGVLLVASAACGARLASPALQKRLCGATIFLLIFADGSVVGISAWLRTDHTQRLDPATGTSWDALGLYSRARRDRTDPVSHLASVLLDASRHGAVTEPSPNFTITYPPAADFHDSVIAGVRAARRPNVVVILMESMRADRLLAERDGRAVMPAVRALAQASRVYPRAFAVATHTNYASPAVLSSQYPMRSTDYFTYPRQIRFPHRFLYDHLKRGGYRTGYFSSDDENWGGKLNYIDTTSLDRFFHAESFTGPTYQPRGSKIQSRWLALRHAGLPDDRITVSIATQWMNEAAGAPFFLYVALQNSHTPYEYPSDFAAPFGRGAAARQSVRFNGVSHDSLRSARDAYDNSLAYDDEQLARLFEALKARGVWENTIVILTSDHAEAFGEHGFGIHGNALYDEQVRIPLLVHAPGLAPGVDTTVASTVDIAPTVLALLGLPPDPAFQGASLLAHTPQRAVYAVVQSGLADQYGMVQGNWKLFYDRGSRRFSLFDLAADPLERRNLADQLPERRRAMAEQLDTWRWAHLHYYETALLRARYFAPQVVPCPVCSLRARTAADRGKARGDRPDSTGGAL